MKEQEQLDYYRIAQAIDYITVNFKEQPSLEQIAKAIHLSPYHFQRLFADWAGTTPKKFLQYISICHAKKLLKEHRATLADTADKTGLSGTGRLHDLFISIEGMSPAEYKNGGKNLSIQYSFVESAFGNIIIASTTRGICHMSFYEQADPAVEELRKAFPNSVLSYGDEQVHLNASMIFRNKWDDIGQVKLHLKGTGFQLKVWEMLLRIPPGSVTTYQAIADNIQNTRAARAVGTAIGSNPVALLIPCHRVISSSGDIGNYKWGAIRKTAIIGWEKIKEKWR